MAIAEMVVLATVADLRGTRSTTCAVPQVHRRQVQPRKLAVLGRGKILPADEGIGMSTPIPVRMSRAFRRRRMRALVANPLLKMVWDAHQQVIVDGGGFWAHYRLERKIGTGPLNSVRLALTWSGEHAETTN